jgi:hypothetical protein
MNFALRDYRLKQQEDTRSVPNTKRRVRSA